MSLSGSRSEEAQLSLGVHDVKPLQWVEPVTVCLLNRVKTQDAELRLLTHAVTLSHQWMGTY